MKKILLIALISIGLGACTKPDYKEHKKIVIRPIEKKVIIKLVLEAGANFDFDRANLRDQDIKKLDKFIEYIRDKKGSLNITGHTDTRGSKQYNEKLSLRRALAVRDYIAEKLVLSTYDIEVTGRGEIEPLVEEKTKGDMAINRRVEVLFKER